MNRRQNDALSGTFGSMMLLIPLGAGAEKASEHDGQLLALCEAYVSQWRAARDAWDITDTDERWQISGAAVDSMFHNPPSSDPAWRLALDISRIPARTPEGMQAKARVVQCWLRDCGAEFEPRCSADAYTAAAWSLVSDILGRAAA